MIRAVIVDFDDTLCMTREECYDLENRVALEMGFPPIDKEVYRKTWGQSLEEVAEVRIPGIDLDDFMERVRKISREAIQKGELTKISSENLATLDKLILQGYLMCILTTRTHAEAEHLLHEGHPLTSRIKFFHFREVSEYKKPDPRVFDYILHRYDLKPEEAVYVGDAVNDGIAAKGRGLYFIATLESGIRTEEDFKDVRVDRFIKKFDELDEAVNALRS